MHAIRSGANSKGANTALFALLFHIAFDCGIFVL